MAVRKMIYLGDPVLRQKSQKIKQLDKSTEKLVDDMVETMHADNGIGLAANQVGVPQRVIVVQLPPDEEDPQAGKLYALINPEIVAASDELLSAEEGCLSIPYYYGEVTRHEAVVVRGRDRKFHEIKIKAEGWLARVFQHEIDHLNGILFIDRMESMDKLRYVPPRADGETAKEGETEPRARAEGGPRRSADAEKERVAVAA